MRCLILPFLVFLAACATPREAKPEISGIAEAAPPPDCTPSAPYGGYLFWMDSPSVPPGSSVRLTPWFTPQPGVMESVPEGCFTADEVDGPGQLLEDGRTVRIAADASSGSVVVVRGRIGDAGISGRIIVYAPQAMPLVGTWSQSGADCGSAEPLRELVFKGDGTFSATWTPFEAYKDYWGTYTYDQGLLSLTPSGGNHIPADAGLSGPAGLSGDTLDPGPGFFGSPVRGVLCEAPFRR